MVILLLLFVLRSWLLIPWLLILFYTDVYDFLSILEFLDTTLIPPLLIDPDLLLRDD